MLPGICVVYMSGYAGDEVSDRGLVERCAAFLQKPFSADELVRTVRGALDAGRRPV
jgi:CheY-like chemotaxis protein